jgi:hypothetical protein
MPVLLLYWLDHAAYDEHINKATRMTPLQQKLRDNKLRQTHQDILSQLPSLLASILTTSAFVSGADAQSIITTWHSQVAPYLPGSAEHTNDGSGVQQFDNRAGLCRAAGLLTLASGSGYLWLGATAPLLKIDCDLWNRERYSLLSYVQSMPDVSLAIADVNSEHGILMSEHVGCLPKAKRTNNQEIVYELHHW